MKNIKIVKDTGEVVFIQDYDVDLIQTPTKGNDAVIKGDEINLTCANPLFNGFTKKNKGTNSYFNGAKIHELNKRGKIKSLYSDTDKVIIAINE